MVKRRQALRKAQAARRPAKRAVDSNEEIAALKRELAQALERQTATSEENTRLLAELREALDQQTATADVLKLISRSTFDLQPVLDTLVETAARLCNAEQGTIWRQDGDVFSAIGSYGHSEEARRFLNESHPGPGRGTLVGRTVLQGRVVHILDACQDPEYSWSEAVERVGFRTMLGVPLLRDGIPIGAFSLYRNKVHPFSDKQIDLVATFADQAVIAIENVRLITETREALEQQTATAEVLQVINRSPGALAPVFDAVLGKALALCDAAFGILWTYDGGQMNASALRGVPSAYADFLTRRPHAVGEKNAHDRLLRGERLVHIVDAADDMAYLSGDALRRATVELGGSRTLLAVPLRKDNAFLGDFVIYRQQVKPFSDKQIALLENFAAQAVIAMENARLLNETREALDQQTATAEVLQVINSSPGDLAPVFDAILEKAHSLCAVAQGALILYDGAKFRAVAVRGISEAFTDKLRQGYNPGPNHPVQRLLRGERFAQVSDWAKVDDPLARAALAALDAGLRTTLFIPLRKDEALLGYFTAARQEVRPFTEKEIALLESFAAQAVIAMENARLLTETREALEQQTATADVLRIINSSPGELAPVFHAILEKAHSLCAVSHGSLQLYIDGKFRAVATHRLPEALERSLRQGYSPGPNHPTRRLLEGERFAQTVDWGKIDDPIARVVELSGIRTTLYIPLRKDEALLGYFTAARQEVRPFTEKEIALLESFAAQAVIAMENARLLGELRRRTADLARSVDELTATGDVLKIISRSSVDLETVLDTLVETVARLCRADQATMFRRRDDSYHLVASRGLSRQAKDFLLAHPLTADRGTMSGRVELERRAVHIPDVLHDPEYTYSEGQKVQGYRTMLGIPLLREEALVGIFVVNRTRVEPFTDKEIELASSFADQAVIAIENARLFDELRERQAELRVTFDNMGDGVAMFDGQQRLAAWNSNFQQILDMPDWLLARRLTYADYLRILAERGEFGTEDIEAELSRRLQDTERELRLERTRPDGRVIEVRRNAVPSGGFVLIYADITERKRAEAAISAARDAAETALRELQTAQASLVHAQKMAALGQLTAGIAHEIKNPLNFVNNFAGLSVELLDELKEATAQAMGALDANKRAEIVETIGMLTGNLEKIAEHGRRADGIVKSMLQHSRGGSGEQQVTDLNALVEEALNLAYHGARAQDQSFNITFERDLDRKLAPIDIVPQDMMRVFLNLIGNGFYAANKRRRDADGAFRPVLKVTTRDLGEHVEIRVRDNGTGIPPEYREKLFQPFFTTKPTGEGTGLGLSISYEIVTQQHGGTITVDSEVGQFTEFTVRLPRRRHSAAGKVA